MYTIPGYHNIQEGTEIKTDIYITSKQILFNIYITTLATLGTTKITFPLI